MKISMPGVVEQKEIKAKDMCANMFYLCQNKQTGEVSTVLVHVNRSCFFLNTNSISYLGHIDDDDYDGWFDDNCTVIREYQSGDKLVVEA